MPRKSPASDAESDFVRHAGHAAQRPQGLSPTLVGGGKAMVIEPDTAAFRALAGGRAGTERDGAAGDAHG